MKSKLEIYALSVCFAAVVCLVISAGIAGYAIFKVGTPELTMRSYDYNRHQSNESFWKDNNESCSDEKKVIVKPSADAITKQRLESFALEFKAERRDGLQSLIHSLIFILIGSITLLIHWKIAQKTRAA